MHLFSNKMLARTLTLITLLCATFTSSFPHYPRRTIAGVRVLDTPLIRSAQAYARGRGVVDVQPS